MWEKSRGRYPSAQTDSNGWRWWSLVQDWSRLLDYSLELGLDDADRRGKEYVVPEEMEDTILRWVVAQWTFGLTLGYEPDISPRSVFTVKNGNTVSVQGRLFQSHPHSLKIKAKDVEKADYHALVLVNPIYQMAVLVGVIRSDKILEYPIDDSRKEPFYEIPAKELEPAFGLIDPERLEDIKNRPRRDFRQSLTLGPRKTEETIDYASSEKEMVNWWSEVSGQRWELDDAGVWPILPYSIDDWRKVCWYTEQYKKFRKEMNPATGLPQIAAKTAFGLVFNRCPDYHFSTVPQHEHLFLREDGKTIQIKGFDLSKGSPFLSEYDRESYVKIYGEELSPPDYYGLIGIDLQKHIAFFLGTAHASDLENGILRETKTEGIDVIEDGVVVKYKWKRRVLQVEQLSLEGWNAWFPKDIRYLSQSWPLKQVKPLTLVG